LTVWSFTIPVACMWAYMMVLPTNLKPRLLRSLLIASDSLVLAGTCFIAFQEFCMGLPPVNRQM
jgi:hypothetical protein